MVWLLRRAAIWGAAFKVLLRKEMVVSDGWDGRPWVFRGGLLMPSLFCARLRRSWLRLLLVLLDVRAAAEALSLPWWVDGTA